MSRFLLILTLSAIFMYADAQEAPTVNPFREMELENSTEKTDEEANDDAYRQLLEGYQKHPIDLNRANVEALEELQLLTAIQIQNFISYRELFGDFLNLFELQAIPSWDLETIRNLLPYIRVNSEVPIAGQLIKRLSLGDQYFLLRASTLIEKPKGYLEPKDSTKSHYLGGRQKLFFRYKYNYKNLLQFGLLGDKDAGEPFFKGKQQYGFDFYSFHLFSRNMGIIKSLALGDFTVNMGQGLIQWQALAFSKGAEVIPVKRESSVLRPYNAAGEFNFHRGAGISLQKGNWQSTVFGSYKKISANAVFDPVGNIDYVTSFQSSGYHRTRAENEDRNNLVQTTVGGNLSFVKQNYRLGINAVFYGFSSPLIKQEKPYNLFSLRGNSWTNQSIDYSYTYRNLHFFGEAAIDKYMHMAFINGALISVAPSVDITVLYRNIDKAYQSLYSNAFTENPLVNNEHAIYTGIAIRPFGGLKLQAYFDLFKFPWLKYLVDAPSFGREHFLQLVYQPYKSWAIYSRYKNESKMHDLSGSFLGIKPMSFVTKQDWRTETFIQLNNKMRVRNRVELLWYDDHVQDREEGFLVLMDFFYKHNSSINGNLRLQYFETGGYNSRVYVYENDVLYYSSIPSFYDKGFRYYLNLNLSPQQRAQRKLFGTIKMEAWLRWAQTVYNGKTSIGSGLDEIQGNRKSEIRAQLIFRW